MSVWTCTQINMESVLIYGCQIWCLPEKHKWKTQEFISRCPRNISRMSLPNVIPNKEFWQRCKQSSKATEITTRNGIGYAILFANIIKI